MSNEFNVTIPDGLTMTVDAANAQSAIDSVLSSKHINCPKSQITAEQVTFDFDQLGDSGKESAREWFRQGSIHDEWWDSVYEDFGAICSIIGVELETKTVNLMNGSTRQEPELYFSGFSHQGQGSSFTGSWKYKQGSTKRIRDYTNDEELVAIADELMSASRQTFYRLEAQITAPHRYPSVSIECTVESTDHCYGIGGFDKQRLEAESALEDLNSWFFAALEREYDYLNSDEQVDESIRINDYKFDESGAIA